MLHENHIETSHLRGHYHFAFITEIWVDKNDYWKLHIDRGQKFDTTSLIRKFYENLPWQLIHLLMRLLTHVRQTARSVIVQVSNGETKRWDASLQTLNHLSLQHSSYAACSSRWRTLLIISYDSTILHQCYMKILHQLGTIIYRSWWFWLGLCLVWGAILY